MSNKVLITDMLHSSEVEERRVLSEAGIELDTALCRSEKQLIEEGRGCAGFLVSYAPVTSRVMEALPDLQVIVKYGIGVDNIDVPAATSMGKIVANVPDAASEEVAVHALSLLLNGLRMTDFFARTVRRSAWNIDPEKYIPYRVSQISLGLVGFGRISQTLAQLARALFDSVLVYDPYTKQESVSASGCVPVSDVVQLFTRCKAISVHVPLTDTTHGLINTGLLELASGLVLVNTSRGEVLDRASTVESIRNGTIAFFGSDVLWTEPPDFDDPEIQFLMNHDRVMLTPHIGWCSRPAAAAIRRQAADEVRNVLIGRRPRNPVNPEVLKQRPDLK